MAEENKTSKQTDGKRAEDKKRGFFKRLKAGLFRKESPAKEAAAPGKVSEKKSESKTHEKTRPSSLEGGESAPSPSAEALSAEDPMAKTPLTADPLAEGPPPLRGAQKPAASGSDSASSSLSLKEKSDDRQAKTEAETEVAAPAADAKADEKPSEKKSAEAGKEGAAVEDGPGSESAATSAPPPRTTAESPVQKPRAQSQAREVKLPGLFAFKMETVSLYDEKGKRISATALHYEPWRVSQVKTKEKDGYSAVQLACRPQKNGRCGKALTGHLKSAGFKEGALRVREIRLLKDAPEDIQPGCELSLESLAKGDKVRISGLSKGRGFSGVMKRWGFRGGKASHGAKTHRKTGAVGQHTEPSRVFPGRKMPGRFGYKKISVRNVQVADVLPEERLIFVKGAVPGARRSLIALTKQPKLSKRAGF